MTFVETTRHVREADRIPDDEAPLRLDPLDPTPVLGTWWNTNQRTWGIHRAELTERAGTESDGNEGDGTEGDRNAVWMHVWAADPAMAEPVDWGEVAVERLYTDGPRSNVVCGYTATFELGHARTHIQANQNHGLTVLAAFTTFTDDSGRLSYFSREFYHRRG